MLSRVSIKITDKNLPATVFQSKYSTGYGKLGFSITENNKICSCSGNFPFSLDRFGKFLRGKGNKIATRASSVQGP